MTDAKGIIKYSAGVSAQKLNIPKLGLSKNTIEDFLPDLTSAPIQEKITSAIESKHSQILEVSLTIENNEIFYTCKIEPLISKRRQVQFVLLHFDDITDIIERQREIAKEIEELKEYRDITNSISDAIFAIDNNGKITFWNKTSENLFGFTKSEVFGKFFGKVLGIFSAPQFDEIMDELVLNDSWNTPITVYTHDGKKEIINAKFTAGSKNGSSIVVLCSNVTNQFNKEQQLKDSLNTYQNFLEDSNELFCNFDDKGNIRYANKSFCKLLGYSNKEILNRNISNLVSQEYFNKTAFDFYKIASQNKIVEIPFQSKSGKALELSAKFFPLPNDQNTISNFNLILKDLTGEKDTKKELEIYKSAFNSSQDGIIIKFDGKIGQVNKSFAEIFGYDNEEDLIEKQLIDLVADVDIPKVESYIQQIKKNTELTYRFDFLAKRKDNVNFFAEVSTASFKVDDKNYIVLVARDVTERKRAQQAIKNSEEKYRNLTNNIDDFLFTFERIEGNIRPVFYTSSVEKITGYTQSDLLTDSKLFLKIIFPNDFPDLKKKLKSIWRSHLNNSGEFELRIINKQGNIVWVRTKINVLRDDNGIVNKVYGLVSDISLRKKAEDELNKSTQNLVKLNETKDRFISIISHDLRTPFSSILGFTDLLLSDSDLSENEKRQYVEYIQESSKSMLSLVNSLLDWTRLQTGRIRFEPERIDVSNIIENSLNTVSGVAFQKGIQLNSNVSNDTNIFVDKDLISQVFNNLLSNAIKFTKEGGNISIEVKKSEHIRFLEFSIKDTGIGIKPENIEKLFRVDTKFSSKGTSGEKGTGLGLSLVKEIIDKHGGNIWVESEYGKGSDFKFTLPIASPNILLVDDSKTDKLLYSKILKNFAPDYQIETASDGKEALDIILKSAPALIITDHKMPYMNGYDLILEINNANIKSRPPVIVLSIDLDRNIIRDYNDLGIEYVFQKPVNLTNFKIAVEKTLRKGLLGM